MNATATVPASVVPILETIAARPATHGIRLVTIDGPSGAGKSTLAAALAVPLSAALLHSDDFVPGWSRLNDGVQILAEQIVAPLAAGRHARAREYDWDALVLAGWRDIAPAPVVIIEGCGVGSIPNHALVSTRIWVEAPAAERELRIRARDNWPGYAPYRTEWRLQEEELQLRHEPRERADIRVTSLPHRWLVEATEHTAIEGASQ